jgi:hypothetical protein
VYRHFPLTGPTAPSLFDRSGGSDGDIAVESREVESRQDQGSDRSSRTGTQSIPYSHSPPFTVPVRTRRPNYDVRMPTIGSGVYRVPSQHTFDHTSAPLFGGPRRMTISSWGTEATEGHTISQYRQPMYDSNSGRVWRGVGSIHPSRLPPRRRISDQRRQSYAGLDADLIRCRTCGGPCGTFCRNVQVN